MTSVTATEGRPVILDAIDAADRRRRLWFRAQYAAAWIALVGLLIFALWLTDNVDTEWIATWGPYIVGGTWTTILVCVISMVLATTLALIGAMGRLSRNPIASGVAGLYVSLVRGTPLLVQIYFVYLALPQMGIRLDALLAGILALGFNYGAYMTEIFRAGIQAVPSAQREAAESLGMPERLVMRRIVLPQAVRIVIPAIGNDFVAMIKDSALVSTISVTELLWRAEAVGTRNFRTLQAILIAAAIYWGLTIIFSFFQNRLERRMARGDR
ncbi:MAG TPA: amino acid ABC transporter permease [Candidatus Limnocylindria bacterium]|nr:amino acid ABC transporter permease [Candidatus Limnocylindria bacterium]